MTTATRPRTASNQAQAAKAIRHELKAAYPHTTFRVTSQGFAGGDSVDIHWTDGPTSDQVTAITAKYQYGHFDGMIDLYESTNRRDDIPQSRYVHGSRSHSPATLAAIVLHVNTSWGFDLVIDPATGWLDSSGNRRRPNGCGYQAEEVWRTFSPKSLVCPSCQRPTAFADAYCGECGAKVATT